MKKIISGIALSLMTLTALADEAAVTSAPKIDTDPTALIICAVLFVGMIGGFAAYVWIKDRAEKAAGKSAAKQ